MRFKPGRIRSEKAGLEERTKACNSVHASCSSECIACRHARLGQCTDRPTGFKLMTLARHGHVTGVSSKTYDSSPGLRRKTVNLLNCGSGWYPRPAILFIKKFEHSSFSWLWVSLHLLISYPLFFCQVEQVQ